MVLTYPPTNIPPGIELAKITLRPVRMEDARQLWEWRNDEKVRMHSFDSDAIQWEFHLRWLEERLKSASPGRFWIVDYDSKPVGQVRIDCSSAEEGTISISLDVKARGHGLGVAVIALASREAIRQLALPRLVAMIKSSNQQSLAAFAAAGYRRSGGGQVKEQACIRMSFPSSGDEVPT